MRTRFEWSAPRSCRTPVRTALQSDRGLRRVGAFDPVEISRISPHSVRKPRQTAAERRETARTSCLADSLLQCGADDVVNLSNGAATERSALMTRATPA